MLERDLADEVRVGRVCGAKDEPLPAVLLDEVDEAGAHAARLVEQPDDAC
jgi:hypothetical protein